MRESETAAVNDAFWNQSKVRRVSAPCRQQLSWQTASHNKLVWSAV